MQNATNLTQVAPSTPHPLTSETTPTNIVVLKPRGGLTGTALFDFQAALEYALEVSLEAVIVDLQQVERVSSEGISVLLMGLELAAILGKSLVFYAMNLATRAALKTEWKRSREISFGPWGDLFEKDFERFLAVEL